MNVLLKEIVDASHIAFIQNNWTPQEGDYVWDGFKIHILGSSYYFMEGPQKLKIAYFDGKAAWHNDFRTVQFATVEYPLITISNPIWLPVGFDKDNCCHQIDMLLKKKIGLATDAALDRSFRYWLDYRIETIDRNLPYIILKLGWLKDLCK
jgi:hypothetical protein